VSERLTLLQYSPTRDVSYGSMEEEDRRRLQYLLRTRFPQEFGSSGGHSAMEGSTNDEKVQAGPSSDEDCRSSISSEADYHEAVDSSFDNTPYEDEFARRAGGVEPIVVKVHHGRAKNVELCTVHPIGDMTEVTRLGSISNSIALTILQDCLYYITDEQTVFKRPNISKTFGQPLDWALEVVNMTSSPELLIALDRHGYLWRRDTVGRPIQWPGLWREYGTAPPWTRAICASHDHLYAAVPLSGQLLRRQNLMGVWKFECHLPVGALDITAVGTQILCLTSSGNIFRHLQGSTVWKYDSTAPNGVALSTYRGQVLCARTSTSSGS